MLVYADILLSSRLYHMFDQLLVLSGGRSFYNGAAGAEPSDYFASRGHPCPALYNPADHLLDLATAPPAGLLGPGKATSRPGDRSSDENTSSEKVAQPQADYPVKKGNWMTGRSGKLLSSHQSSRRYTTTFLTQFEVLSGREWINLRRYVSCSARKRMCSRL